MTFLFVLLAAWCQAATLGLQPYLQNLGENRASILWTTTDGPGRGEVHYSRDASLDRIVASQARLFSQTETQLPYDFWLHRADLVGLEANTAYRYRVFLDGNDVTHEDLRVYTARAPPPIRFVVFGDSGDGGPVQLDVMRRMADENPAFVLHAGDLAYEQGTFLQLHEFFFRVYQGLASRFPFFPVPGNHDYGSRAAAAYLAMFTPPESGVPEVDKGRYYSFDWGPIHVVALDSNRPLLDAAAGLGQMLRWLERDLQATDRQWRIAIFHHTPFPNGHHAGDENCALAQERIVPILDRHGVHLVLSGHEHLYQRSKAHRQGAFLDSAWGTVYVTTGGGGYALHQATPRPFAAVTASVSHYLSVQLTGNEMRVQAVSQDGGLIDDFTLSSSPSIAVDGIGNAASFTPALAPGGLFTIVGKDLARGGEKLSGAPLPAHLNGLHAMIGSQAAPLLYVSRNQVNAQIPFGLFGKMLVELDGPNGTATREVMIGETAPAVFLVDHHGQRRPAIVHSDGVLVSPDAPAAAGEWLSIYLTGLGAVSPELPAGLVAPPAILYRANAPVRVTVDNEPAEVLFAGLAPGLVGVNQINFKVPRVTPGDRLLTVASGAGRSAEVALSCR